MSWGSAPGPAKNAAALPIDALDRPSVFETVRVYDGTAAGPFEHCQRLRDSARSSGIPVPDLSVLRARLNEAVRRSGFRNAIARLAVNAAPGVREARMGCSVRAFDGCPGTWYTRGVTLVTAAVRRTGPRSSFPQVKGGDYLNALTALGSGPVLAVRSDGGPTRDPGADPLLLTDEGTVSETSVSNLTLLKDGVLWTPPVSCGILLGVTRRIVLSAAARHGLKVRTAAFTRHDVYNADEVLLTGSAVEVLPVTEVDRRMIAAGRPGPWAPALRRAYLTEALGG